MSEPSADSGTHRKWLGVEAELAIKDARAIARHRAERLLEEIDLADKLYQALLLTREYVGEDMMPAVEGWSWFDAVTAYEEVRGLRQNDGYRSGPT